MQTANTACSICLYCKRTNQTETTSLQSEPDFQTIAATPQIRRVCFSGVFVLCLKSVSSKIPRCQPDAVMCGPNPIYFSGTCEMLLFKAEETSQFFGVNDNSVGAVKLLSLASALDCHSFSLNPLIITFVVSFCRNTLSSQKLPPPLSSWFVFQVVRMKE